LNDRHRSDELILVIQIASIDRELASVRFMLQCRSELPALIGIEFGITHPIRDAIEAAHAAVPALGYFEAGESIDSPQVLISIGEAKATRWLIGACLQEKIRSSAHLPTREYH
jgi:hypothetical protein